MADLINGTAGALADVLHGATSALADVLDRPLGAFSNILDGVARASSDLADALAGPCADLFERLPDALEQLRIAIERGQHAVDDRGDVVETRSQQRLSLDALDVQLDLPELDVNADAQLDQVEYLGVQ